MWSSICRMRLINLKEPDQPDHLSVLLSGYTPTRQLRSSDRHLLSQPADNTAFASRAFSSAAPRIWNGLPLPVWTAPSVNTFRRHLKTYLFSSTTAHWLTNRSIRAYNNSNSVWHMERYKCCLLTYLLLAKVMCSKVDGTNRTVCAARKFRSTLIFHKVVWRRVCCLVWSS